MPAGVADKGARSPPSSKHRSDGEQSVETVATESAAADQAGLPTLP